MSNQVLKQTINVFVDLQDFSNAEVLKDLLQRILMLQDYLSWHKCTSFIFIQSLMLTAV